MPGLSRAEANPYADELVRNFDDLRALHQASPSLSRTILVNSAKASLVGAGLDLTVGALVDLSTEGQIDWTRRAKSALVTFGAVGAGSEIGQGTVAFMTRNPILARFAERSSRVLGLGSSSIVTNTLGSAVGAGAASVFLAYGGYLMGLYDLETANRVAVSGAAGAAASALFVGGAFAAAAAFGTLAPAPRLARFRARRSPTRPSPGSAAAPSRPVEAGWPWARRSSPEARSWWCWA